MYVCDKCGDTVAELESRTYYDCVPGNSGMSGYETEVDDRCSCGGYYEDGAQCEECGEWKVSSEIYEGYCEKCLQGKVNLNTVLDYARNRNCLNDLLCEFLFKEEDVNRVLVKELTNAYKSMAKGRIDLELRRYVDEDRCDFGTYLKTI